MQKILLVEDEAVIVRALEEFLRAEGFETRAVSGQRRAAEALCGEDLDLALLDISLADGDGFAVCARAKERGIPVIFLTASGEENSVVRGLDLGADDYIAKPFRIRVLLARVAAALRRVAAAPAAAGADSFAIGTARIDARRFLLDPGDGSPAQSLSARELGLLRAFAAHPGEVLSRDELLNEVWGVDYVGGPRTLDQHVLQIRRKLGPSADRIETVHRAGYRYRAG